MARRPSLSAPVVAPSVAPAPAPFSVKQSSRKGKRAVAFWIDAADYEEFQIAIVRARTTIQAVGAGAIAQWMQQQGVKGRN